MSERTNTELVKELLEAFTILRLKMEDPNYVQLEGSIRQLIDNQNGMKEDVSDLKQRLLNPYDGVVVEIRKNTEFRHEWERKQKDYETLHEEHRDLVKWKTSFVKTFWTIFTATVGVISYMIINMIKK